jgi:hypothetical protein
VFFGPLVFGRSILSNHPKKDSTSIGDTFVENYQNIRKLMKCCLTIKNCVGMWWNFLESSFLQISDIHKAPYLVNYIYIPGHICGHISQGPYLCWEGSYAYSSIGCTLHLHFIPYSHHLWCIPLNLVGVQFFNLALARGDLWSFLLFPILFIAFSYQKMVIYRLYEPVVCGRWFPSPHILEWIAQQAWMGTT